MHFMRRRNTGRFEVKRKMSDPIVDLAYSTAQAHIYPYGATFLFISVAHEKKSYFVKIDHVKCVIEEQINLYGIPENIIEEYVHCRLHGMAASLIGKLFPLKLF